MEIRDGPVAQIFSQFINEISLRVSERTLRLKIVVSVSLLLKLSLNRLMMVMSLACEVKVTFLTARMASRITRAPANLKTWTGNPLLDSSLIYKTKSDKTLKVSSLTWSVLLNVSTATSIQLRKDAVHLEQKKGQMPSMKP